MKVQFWAALAACALVSAPAFAAEPIVGMWKRGNGTMIEFAPCSGGFCGTVRSGEYSGQPIGTMAYPAPTTKAPSTCSTKARPITARLPSTATP